MTIKRALISVSDKTGVADFAAFLHGKGVELVSTGGTAKLLREHDLPVKDISELTGFPEMLDGRVKTLHPKVHGGLLFVRGNPEHEKTVAAHGIGAIDLVIVNLYPFEDTVKRGASPEETIENIDIGGPSMLRSAAKNFAAVTVICDAADFAAVKAEIESAGDTTLETRRKLAGKVFARTAKYDAAIAHYFDPGVLPLVASSPEELRYGENPHQQAAFYRLDHAPVPSIGTAKILQGKKMGYCNFLDADAALSLALEFSHQPAAAIIKHATPCGVAVGGDLTEAYAKALAADPVSAFGGVVALNRRIDRELAERMADIFYEIIIAPEFSAEALAVFANKPNLRLLETGSAEPAKGRRDLRSVSGGILVQDADEAEINPEYLHVENGRLQESETGDVNFAWRVVKHVKSNAIAIIKDGQTLGLGGGQTSRVGAAEIAIRQAGDKARGAVAASDAFFPFPDGIELLAEAGVSIIVQPGGSKNDEAVFAAARQHGIRMVLTGMRAFKH